MALGMQLFAVQAMSGAALKVLIIVAAAAKISDGMHTPKAVDALVGRLATPERAAGKDSWRAALKNSCNAIYTVEMRLGGQRIMAFPDTGSFDLVVFSGKCEECNAPHPYRPSKSKTFTTTGFELTQYYGSGTATSTECHDSAELGNVSVRQQVFWSVENTDYGFYGVDFDAILGLGPPSSAVRIDEMILGKMQKNLESMIQEHRDTSRYNETIQHYIEAIRHAKLTEPVLQASSTVRFSICLSDADGADGTLVWNDDQDFRNPHVFSHVNLVGSMYWSASVSDVQFSDGSKLGCTGNVDDNDNRCKAMLDSGTSLLVVPEKTYEMMRTILDTHGCAPESLPSLNFRLGAEEFTLPPSAFVGFATGDMNENFKATMPDVYEQNARSLRRGGGGRSCSLMAMASSGNDDGPAWILGLPFFRKYYTSFTLDDTSRESRQVHFAEKDDSCNPVPKTAFRAVMPIHGPLLNYDTGKIRGPGQPFSPIVSSDAGEHSRRH